MKKNITSVFVASARVPKNHPYPQIDYWDAKLKGFGLRVTLAGGKSWMLMYRRHSDGKKIRHTFGSYPVKSLADARGEAKKILGRVADGKDPATEKTEQRAEQQAEERDAESFKAIADEFETEYVVKKRPSTQLQYRMIIKRDLIPAWGSRKVRDITRRDVNGLLRSVKERAEKRKHEDPVERPTGVIANRTLAVVRKLFNWAIKEERLESNPAARIERPADETTRERVLTPDEIRKVWKAVADEPKPVAGFIKLVFLTCQRRGEILGMRWDEIDDLGWWTIPRERTKNDRTHRVFLVPAAVEILKGLGPQEPRLSEFVFPNSQGKSISNPQKWLRSIKKTAGVNPRPHDIRRTDSTLMASHGIDDRIISRVLNHKLPGETNKVYNRYSYDKEKRAALMKLAGILENIVAGKERKGAKVVELRA